MYIKIAFLIATHPYRFGVSWYTMILQIDTFVK